MSADDAATGGRFDVRQSHLPEADVQVDGDATLVQLHSRLVDALDDAIVAVLREVPGDDIRDYRHRLDATIDALDGRLADALATLAHGTRRDADRKSVV